MTAIRQEHIGMLQYISRLGGRVNADRLTPLSLEHCDVLSAEGLCEYVKVGSIKYVALTGAGRHVAAIGRFPAKSRRQRND